MRCGTPVVATDIPGAREVVKVTGMGKIVSPRDPEAMGAAIVDVLDNPADYVKPLPAINAAFNFEETVDRYEQHLRYSVQAAKRQ
jgi:glycosyltransferase involved in cell wall biosynthesis